MGRIWHIMVKEFIQAFRDRRMIGIIFIAPIIQLFLFGYAVTNDVKNIDMAVMDRDKSPASRELAEVIFRSGYFSDVGRLESSDEIEGALVHGFAKAVLVIPADFARQLDRGETAAVQFLVDGAESNTALVGVGYLGKILAAENQSRIVASLTRLTAAKGLTGQKSLPLVFPETRYRYNPELKSSFFMVPAVLAMILMIITMLLTSLAITREREIGTMEQLVVTPIRPWQLLAGKMLPFTIIGFIDVNLILIVAVGHFKLPFVGSLWLIYIAMIIFLFTTLGMGLLISTVSGTQQQAIFVALMFMLPAILLSGFMFPIANMPEVIQWLTYLNPLRYLLVIVRGVILKGNGISVLFPQFGMMLLLGAGLFSLAAARFRKTIG
ncbi:MAG: ABC transporter permease [bacterium]|nr:ABC transporter permease [bacterium]